MSLTSLVSQKTTVRQKLADWFPKPRLPLDGALIVPSVAKNRSLIGTAYDYLLRFHLERSMAHATGPRWIAYAALNWLNERELDGGVMVGDDLCEVADVAGLMSLFILDAEDQRERFLKSGRVTKKLIQAALNLAHCDVLHRIGWLDARFGEAAGDDEVAELRSLIKVTPLDKFTDCETCLLNPDFGVGSTRIGGADADLLLDDTLIEVKTTINLQLRVETWRQLIGYAALNEHFPIGGGHEPRPIRNIGIYFARHGVFKTWPLRHLVAGDRFAEFAVWLASYVDSRYAKRLERQAERLLRQRRRLIIQNQERNRTFRAAVARANRIKGRHKRYKPRPNIERARTTYLPKKIKWLFIAEAPPAASDRFFYYRDVRSGDSLFLETMRTLYKTAKRAPAEEIRAQKSEFLEKFQKEGCFLIDVCDVPIKKAENKNVKVRGAAHFLEDKLDALRVAGQLTGETRILLISRTVFDHCHGLLTEAGFNVVNSDVLPFPASGHQVAYRKKLSCLLRAHGYAVPL